MRVALLQVRQDAKNRAANIQGITAAIDRAGSSAPAPDLLVLPGACDTGGGSVGSRLAEPIMQMARETISFKAREWGVFVALGLHARYGDMTYPNAVLLDPDGDVVAESVSPAPATETEAEGAVQLWPGTLGRIGMVTAEMVGAALDDTQAGACGALYAWPRGPAATAKSRRLEEFNLARLDDNTPGLPGVYWCVVSAAGSTGRPGGDQPSTFLLAPDGRMQVSVPKGEEAIVYAEVPIKPAPLPEPGGVFERDDHAD